MNDTPVHHRHPPTTDRPLASLVVGLLLVASVPLVLWALANSLLAVLLVGVGSLTVTTAVDQVP